MAALILVILGLSACGGATQPAEPPSSATTQDPSPAEEPAPEETQPGEVDRPDDAAPDFSVTTFDGERFTLAEQTGMPVVINFFDSW
jgi:cytochrome oxidase Cu insertion factor (SCO1/SenC/PrrC family)